MFDQKKVESHFPVNLSISAKVKNLLNSKILLQGIERAGVAWRSGWYRAGPRPRANFSACGQPLASKTCEAGVLPPGETAPSPRPAETTAKIGLWCHPCSTPMPRWRVSFTQSPSFRTPRRSGLTTPATCRPQTTRINPRKRSVSHGGLRTAVPPQSFMALQTFDSCTWLDPSTVPLGCKLNCLDCKLDKSKTVN